MDLNDMHVEGKLASALDGLVPLNERARREDSDKPPRVHSVRALLNASAKQATSAEEKKTICTWGHYELDDLTGGLEPGFVWLVGAPTSFGKTSLVISVADENIKAGRRVMIVSSEDSKELYADRLMVRRARVDAKRYRRRRLETDEVKRVLDVASQGQDVPVLIEAGKRPIEDIARHMERVIQDEGIDVIAFDYLGEFASNSRHQDQRLKIQHIAAVMRDLVKGNGKSGIILSQLTEPEEGKRPTRNNIRDSRDVANAAEGILLGYTPTADVMDGGGGLIMEAGRKHLLIDKNKAGPAKRAVAMEWRDDYACFETVVDPEQAALDDMMPSYYERDLS